jgi:hypothetical protein
MIHEDSEGGFDRCLNTQSIRSPSEYSVPKKAVGKKYFHQHNLTGGAFTETDDKLEYKQTMVGTEY